MGESNFFELLKSKTIKKYIVEIVLIIFSIVLTVISMAIYLVNNKTSIDDEEIPVYVNQNTQKIFVDVSGEVNKPDVYEVTPGERLNNVIGKAGGLTENADNKFFYRNFNQARILSDQEKIYIPSIWEVDNGYFSENPQAVNNTISSQQSFGFAQDKSALNNELININSASFEELDTLPGVGKITGEKIINNRPFKALDELINKKIVSKSVFENIKSLIEL